MSTIQWQRIEAGLVMLVALALVPMAAPDLPLWLWPVLLLAPDLAILAYLFGKGPGAQIYNLAHLYGLGAALAALGLWLGQPCVIAGGLFWIAHVGMDRVLGFGLKEPDSFDLTHLGRARHK